MKKIMIQIPLTKYLREISKDKGNMFLTKTRGGQVWISNEAPGEMFEDDEDKNYIEFNDSDIFFKLPKEIHQYIELTPGTFKTLKDALKEIKKREERGSE